MGVMLDSRLFKCGFTNALWHFQHAKGPFEVR